MKRFLSYLRPYRRMLAAGILLTAVGTLCELLLPTIMSNILNNGIYLSDMHSILRNCGEMLAVSLLGLGAAVGGFYCSSRVVSEYCADLRTAIFQTVNTMSFEEMSRIGTSALLTRSTHDTGTLGWVASMLSGSLVSIPVLFLGGVILAMRRDVVLSLVMLIFLPAVFLVVLQAAKKVASLWETSDKYTDRQNDVMRERLHGIRVIRAFNREPHEQERIDEATHAMAENIITANLRMGIVGPLAMGLMNVSAVLILYLGGYRMEHGLSPVSGGDIFALVQYVALVLNGTVMAAFAITMYPHAKVAAKRMGEVLDAEKMAESTGEDVVILSGDIRFDHVSFRYEGADRSAVSDISLHILPGQKISVIGGTGSGKSTLVQLLMGFRAPSEGKIFFDGKVMEALGARRVRQNVSCVLQRSAIYAGTIRDNIRMGRPEATEEEIRAAAEIAQLSDFIATLPEGLDHELEQAGKNLSGGQKQRIGIARAVLKDAPVFLFDDSFSALDFMTEARLRSALNARAAGKTQIVITQRVSSAMNSDCIFVMNDGVLADSGTHGELLERCEIYREIYLSQTGGERR